MVVATIVVAEQLSGWFVAPGQHRAHRWGLESPTLNIPTDRVNTLCLGGQTTLRVYLRLATKDHQQCPVCKQAPTSPYEVK